MSTLRELYQQSDDFVKKYDLTTHADHYRKLCSVGNINEIMNELESLQADGRQLRIGIIGRVKAGKSSLLNALLFQGEDVLPKAATPMTAALTVMTYSDTVHADIDFFSEADIAEIKRQHDDFQQALTQKISEVSEQRKTRFLRKAAQERKDGTLNEQELQEKARRTALRELAEHPYIAAYEHYARIRATNVSLTSLQAQKQLTADSIEDLMQGELQDFVGANGRYMPFTKSVTLHIPHEGLQGLEIIDTPGINDPVQSRGQRTEEMLQQCDVVLIVSPAGQFLSAEDTQLMQRVAVREGIQEIYLVASQSDNQLFGSEAGRESNLLQVSERITDTLSAQARQVLNEKASKEGSAAAKIYQKVLANNVICTSSAAFSLEQRFERQAGWDGNLQHVWKNLSQRYPDTFNEAASARYALKKLANIERIHAIIDDVRQRKAGIMAERIQKLESAKRQAMHDYLKALAEYIGTAIAEIEGNDISALEEQQTFLSRQISEITYNISNTYRNLIDELNIHFSSELKAQLDRQIRLFESGADRARGSAVEHYQVSTGKSWWQVWKDEYETRSRTINTVNASVIRRTIEDIRAETQDGLNECAKTYKYNWRKQLHNNIIQALRGQDGGNDEYINIRQTNDALAIVINQMPDTEFSLSAGLPNILKKSGTLKKSDADNYLEAARDYMSRFKNSMRSEINNYIEQVVSTFSGINLAGKLTARMNEELNKRIDEIKNKEASLYRYQTMQNELKQLQEMNHE